MGARAPRRRGPLAAGSACGRPLPLKSSNASSNAGPPIPM